MIHTEFLVAPEEVAELELCAVHLVVVLVVGDHPVPVSRVEVVLDHDV